MRCVVASKNAVKVQATESALKAAFPTVNFVVEGEQGSLLPSAGLVRRTDGRWAVLTELGSSGNDTEPYTFVSTGEGLVCGVRR